MAKRRVTIKRAAFNKILNGYIEAALWSSTDNADESGGEPLDKNYSPSDVAASSVRSMKKDIVKFLRGNAKVIDKYTHHRKYKNEDGTIWEHLGHDLWLDRNGHGTGFWDRDYDGHDEIGEALHEGAKILGSSDMYVGDDGKIYVSPER